FYDGENFHWIPGKRIHTKNTHGTGCTLSSAIAANLAKGKSMLDAVREAKKYILIAIENSLSLGNGHGPTHHFYELYDKAGLTIKR
ncbi:bifunctional hydroxymethylpyrimidine kinase/phosphomethylpyrimidine kinase, partial [Pseudomonas sp. MPR-R5A]